MKNIYVMGQVEVIRFRPQEPTLALRIGGCVGDDAETPLQYEADFRGVRKYSFEDIDTCRGETADGLTIISSDIASRIVSDVSSALPQVSGLLVHCQAGWGRSPAVALALNEGLDLGVDTYSFFDPKTQAPNILVYKTVLEAAAKTNGSTPLYSHMRDLESLSRE